MVRWSVLTGCAVVVVGAAFVTGATSPSGPAKPPLPLEAKAEPAKTIVVVGHKTGYFNMAKVMREYKKAQVSVESLNNRRLRLAANVSGLRAMYLDLQTAVQKTADPRAKERLAQDMFNVARRLEDTDREINKLLNARASVIISELYDDIRATATATAREHGLMALLAYPDAVTPQEAENPAIKELKLKPPALQPFYLDASVEYSDEIVRRLNEKYALEHGE